VSTDARSPRYVLADQLPQIRGRLDDMSAQQLADRVQQLGGKLDRAAISKIESRTRNVSLDEAVLLAVALEVAPVHLFLPRDDGSAVALAPLVEVPATQAREWLRGTEQLPQGDEKTYRTEVPDSEWKRARKPSARELDATEKLRSAERRCAVANKLVDMLKAELAGGGKRMPPYSLGPEPVAELREYTELRQDLRQARAELATASVERDEAYREVQRIRRERARVDAETED